MVKKFLVLVLVAALAVAGIGLSGRNAAKAADKPVLSPTNMTARAAAPLGSGPHP
jgi:hypothetical protein